MFALLQVEVPSYLLQNGQFMGFHEFDEGTIRIFDVGKPSRRRLHPERTTAIDREGVPSIRKSFFERVHIQRIEAYVDETAVAPLAVGEQLTGFAVERLQEFNVQIAQ